MCVPRRSRAVMRVDGASGCNSYSISEGDAVLAARACGCGDLRHWLPSTLRARGADLPHRRGSLASEEPVTGKQATPGSPR